MKKSLFASVAVMLVCGSAVAVAQSARQGVAPVIIQQAPAVAPQGAPVEPQVATSRGGTLVLNLTIQIVSAIPTTTPIKCIFHPAVYGVDLTTGMQEMFYESSQLVATRNGATATCRIVIPYYWTLHMMSTARIAPSFEVVATDADGNGRTVGAPQYFVTGGPDSFPIPAPGVVSTFTRTVRL